ncbi:N-acyl-aromatic-L-amino acid amidohydrolase (carboxylate-forming) B-like [Genypterus blacodes]|uniref:N-acyl-aromatic-L-amino acid amidohydrolase (carboxylate-forming) B-like n=1 Tax=Genypterus blacodes TaxID=154954 RepID=UPI003F75D4F5
MERVSIPALSRIAICGGTHGNELSGVHIVREMQRRQIDKVGSASLTTVLSNPRAVQVCRRYVDTDLNRCFSHEILSSPITDSTQYEVRRAQELNAQLGPKGSQEAMDLVCDLHNSTSNMGLCFIADPSDWIPLHIYKYAKNKITSVPVTMLQAEDIRDKSFFLGSVGKHGLAIEIGPQPHGVVRADIFNLMNEAVELTTDWIEKFNSGFTFEGGEVDAWIIVRQVDYPRDPLTHEITAAIHSHIQDKDFCLIRAGDPIFSTFSGETIKYEGEELAPFFVNECAYYEKKIAFYLGRKITLTIPSISVKRE